MTDATVARLSLNGLFASGDIWLRLALEDHFQIPFEEIRPVSQRADREAGSPVNSKTYWDHRKA